MADDNITWDQPKEDITWDTAPPPAAVASPPARELPGYQKRQHAYRENIHAGLPIVPAGQEATGPDLSSERSHNLGKEWRDVGKGVAKGVPASIAGGVLGDVEEFGRHVINKHGANGAHGDVVSSKPEDQFFPPTTQGGYLGPRGLNIMNPAASKEEAAGMGIGSLIGPAAVIKAAKLARPYLPERVPPENPPPPPPPREPPPGFETLDIMSGKPPVKPGAEADLLPRTPDGAPVAVPRDGSGARLLPADVPHVETTGSIEDTLAGRRSAGAAGRSPLEEFSPETIAHMRKTLEQEGVTPWTLEQRLEEMSPHQSLAEFSPNTEAHAGATASPPGAGKNEIINFFRQRAKEAKDRMRSTFDQAFGPAEDLAQQNRVLNIDQSAEAGPLYDRFRSMEIPPTKSLDDLIPRLRSVGAFGEAQAKAMAEGRPWQAEWFTPEQRTSPTAQSWDYVKRALDQKIGGSYDPVSGRATDWTRIYTNLKNDLLSAINRHPDPEIASVWREARAAWAGPEEIKNAQRLGRRLLTKAIDADEFRFETAGFGEHQMQGLRQGLRKELENSLGNPGKTELPVMKQILGENNQQKLRWVIGDEATDAVVRSIEHEFNMHGAPTRIHGNSPTALRQEANKFWTPQEGLFTAKDLASAVHGLTGAAAHVAKKTFLARHAANQEAKFARLRDEAARIYTMQGPERDAVLRYLLSEPPRAKGGRVIKRADGGRAAAASNVISTAQSLAQRVNRAGGGETSGFDTPLDVNDELKFQDWKAKNAPNDSGADYDLRGAFKAGVAPAGPEAGVNEGHWPDTYKKPNHPTFSNQSQYAKDRPDLAGSWNGNTYLPHDATEAGAAREAAARGVARGARHHIKLGDLPPEGSGVAPPEAFPQKTWMMEPDLQGVQSGDYGLPEGAALDDANRPFYPDTGRKISVISRPGVLPLVRTPDGVQFAMPKLLDLASNVMSPLAAGRVPVKAGEMVLGSGAVRKSAEPKLAMDQESRMARARAAGWDMPWYHGGERMDRFTEKGQIDPKRATSGPMPFFTDNPEIASSYATKKADTSLQRTDPGDTVANYFTVNPKSIWPDTRQRTPLTVEQSWSFLPSEMKKEITDRAGRIGYANRDRGYGPFTLHPPGEHAGPSSLDHWNYTLQQNRGNALAALRDLWHDGGMLVGNESELADLYRLAGYPYPISEASAPWTEARGVFPAALRLRNPLRTDNADLLRSSVLPNLERAFKRDRTRLDPYSASDMWDKNNRWTPREWVNSAQEDLRKGENSYVWTSIPDKVTKQLSQMGYDSILNLGGKADPKNGHRVAIPFRPDQVRSLLSARFDPAKDGAPLARNQVLYSDTRNQVIGETGHQIEKAAARPGRNTDPAAVYWHGTASGDLRGGASGLHLGTKPQATTALEARIGIPADGKGWTGSRPYGDTLLAGSDSIASGKYGPHRETGFNAGFYDGASKTRIPFPKEDFYAKDFFAAHPELAHKYPDGTPMPLDVKPTVEPYRITGNMTNTPNNAHPDYRANGYMKAQLKKGNPKAGYFYNNVGEGEGVSAVVPHGGWVEKIDAPPGGPTLYSDTRNQVAGEVGHQVEKAAQPFYSTLERAVEGAKMQKGAPEQWAGYLRNQPGVKPDELDWRLGEALADQPKKQLAKEEVAQLLAQNKVEVKEIERRSQMTDQIVREHHDLSEDVWNSMRERERNEYRNEAAKNYYSPDHGDTKFTEHMEPGENQREFVFTLPPYADEAVPKYRVFDEHGVEQANNIVGRERAERILRTDAPNGRIEEYPGFVSSNQNFQVPSGHSYGDPASDVNRFAHVFTNDIKLGEPSAQQIDEIERLILKAVPSAKSVKSLGSGAADVAVKKGLIKPEEAADWSRDRNMRSGYEDKPGAGKKYLNIAEKQSDWAQKGLHEGYAKDTKGWTAEPLAAPDAGFTKWRINDADGNRVTDIVGGSADSAIRKAAEGVPDFPLKNNWHEVTMKRMIRRAIDEGYDGLSWVDGQTVADRYGLSKQINGLEFTHNRDGVGELRMILKDGMTQTHRIKSKEDLAETVGKGVADELYKQGYANNGKASLHGLDLDIGGEFHKKFYDEALPRDTNKMLKKFGAKVERAEVPGGKGLGGVSGDDVMSDLGMHPDPAGRSHYWRNLSQVERDRLIQEFRDRHSKQGVHVIHFTPEFKARVKKEGFSNFATGGAVKRAKAAVVETAQQLAAKGAIRRAIHGS